MVTTTVLPTVRRGELGPDWFAALQAIERRFVWQARAVIIVVGASGYYMTARADLWDRFRSAGFWWMHAMVGVWARSLSASLWSSQSSSTAISPNGQSRVPIACSHGCHVPIGCCSRSALSPSVAPSRAVMDGSCSDRRAALGSLVVAGGRTLPPYASAGRMTSIGVRREKAALSSGCKAHPAIRSCRKQSEQSWR
jgi:hypothetical protein